MLWSLSSYVIMQHNVLCVRKVPTPISDWNELLAHNLIPHPCYDLKVGPERMILHRTRRSEGVYPV